MNILNKHIVVTGGDGFLGHHLLPLLNKKCKKVTVIKHNEYALQLSDAVYRMYFELKPNIVIHLAAKVGGIQYNKANPAGLFYNNLQMGMNIIHYGLVANLEKLVCLGTICSYPKVPPRMPFREDDLWEGYPEETNAPYGIAKKALLVMCQAYRQQHGMNCIFLMPVNLYGEFDHFGEEVSHVIPALIKKFVDAKDNNLPIVEIWGSGNATREFMYAGDCAKAIILTVEKYNEPKPINLGSGHEIKIIDLAKLIAYLVNYKGQIKLNSAMPDGQPRRLLDTTRMKEVLGFNDVLMPLEQGLERTITWYRKNKDSKVA